MKYKLGFTAFIIYIYLFVLYILYMSIANAHEQNIAFAEWMMSLHQPDNPIASCCGPADQYYAISYSASAEGFNVIIQKEIIDDIFGNYKSLQTISVKEDKVIWDRVNPTGRGVLFMSSNNSVYCFIPGSGS